MEKKYLTDFYPDYHKKSEDEKRDVELTFKILQELNIDEEWIQLKSLPSVGPGENSRFTYYFNRYHKDGTTLSEVLLHLYVTGDPNMFIDLLYRYFSLSGVVVNYDADGNLQVSTRYKCGQKDGEEIYYYPDETVSSIKTYKNNDRHGPTINFDSDGRVTHKFNFSYGSYHGKDEEFTYEKNSDEVTTNVRYFFYNIIIDNGHVAKCMYIPDDPEVFAEWVFNNCIKNKNFSAKEFSNDGVDSFYLYAKKLKELKDG